jgi:hypothetical protein
LENLQEKVRHLILLSDIVVIESLTYKKFSHQLLDEFEVDATESGNEFRFIRDSFELRTEPNVRLEIVDGHILVITNKRIYLCVFVQLTAKI